MDSVVEQHSLASPAGSGVRSVLLGSDERVHLTEEVLAMLRKRGLQVAEIVPAPGEVASWSAVARQVGEAVAAGRFEMGVLFCWTGTGASIAANKIPGVRAALCGDAQTATGARAWNDANVLVMSNRAVTAAVAAEILEAWFAAEVDPAEADNIAGVEPS
jgi:ribose 5-phosphate isomerase B